MDVELAPLDVVLAPELDDDAPPPAPDEALCEPPHAEASGARRTRATSERDERTFMRPLIAARGPSRTGLKTRGFVRVRGRAATREVRGATREVAPPAFHDRGIFDVMKGGVAIALELTRLAESMLRARLARERPSATQEEIDAAVVAWYRERPGAEHGDAEGTPGSWPRKRS